MGGVCCADRSIADRAIADCGLWIADSVDRARVCAPRLGAHRANPQSAIRNPQSNWMKFPDRLPIPPEVLKIAQTLEDSGFETWCVGGAIRDNLLGLENHDFDLTTAAPPEEVRKLFKRTVPVGVEHGTIEAAKANVQGLAQLSAERVRDEWFKGIATAQRVSKLLALWIDTGAARIWLPEIRRPGNGKGEKGNVDKLPRDPVLITALLASDPASLLTRLKCSNKDIERGRAIGQWRDKYPDPQHLPEVRRWLAQAGEYADDLLAVLPALDVSRFPFPVSRLSKVVESIRAAKDPLTLQDLAVNGNDLIAAGVRPGPDVGEVLQRLLAEVLEDPQRNTKGYLLSRV